MQVGCHNQITLLKVYQPRYTHTYSQSSEMLLTGNDQGLIDQEERPPYIVERIGHDRRERMPGVPTWISAASPTGLRRLPPTS